MEKSIIIAIFIISFSSSSYCDKLLLYIYFVYYHDDIGTIIGSPIEPCVKNASLRMYGSKKK